MKFNTIEEFNEYKEENGLSFYELEFEPEIEYTTAQIINPENSQKLIYALIPEEEKSVFDAEKETTLTTKYHDWHNTVTDKIMDELLSEGQIDKDATVSPDYVEEYNRQIEAINKHKDLDYITEEMNSYQVYQILNKNSN